MIIKIMIVATFSEASQYSVVIIIEKDEIVSGKEDLPISPYAFTCVAFTPTKNTQNKRLMTQECQGVQYWRTS